MNLQLLQEALKKKLDIIHRVELQNKNKAHSNGVNGHSKIIINGNGINENHIKKVNGVNGKSNGNGYCVNHYEEDNSYNIIIKKQNGGYEVEN